MTDFRINPDAARDVVARAITENNGQPLSLEQERIAALSLLLDAALPIVREYAGRHFSAMQAATERAQTGWYTLYAPQGDPIERTNPATGERTRQLPPLVEYKVYARDLPAFCEHHGLNLDKILRVLDAEIGEHKGWRNGPQYGKEAQLNTTPYVTPRTQEEWDEIMGEGSMIDKPHPLARPREIPTWGAPQTEWDPNQPDELGFDWEPGSFLPTPKVKPEAAALPLISRAEQSDTSKSRRFGRK